ASRRVTPATERTALAMSWMTSCLLPSLKFGTHSTSCNLLTGTLLSSPGLKHWAEPESATALKRSLERVALTKHEKQGPLYSIGMSSKKAKSKPTQEPKSPRRFNKKALIALLIVAIPSTILHNNKQQGNWKPLPYNISRA